MEDAPEPTGPGRSRLAARAAGRGMGVAGRAVRRAGGASGRATGQAASYTLRQARRASRAEGAHETGLHRLIELHTVNTAGDAAVAVSLAGTLFFAQPGEARGHVALFLALTMLPFAVVAPLLGPFLDRFSHGRRWAIGATMALRAFMCWVMAGAVASHSIGIYPAALGSLVASKAYGVARAATVPRLLPEGLTLARANGRLSLSGVVGASVSAPLAAGAATFGTQWALRYGFVVFVGATILAVLLPARADSSAGELPVSMSGTNKAKYRVPGAVVFALRCNAGLRMLSGFMTMYMAFLLRAHPLPGWEHRTTLLMGVVIGAAGLGNTIGIGLGSVLRRLHPGTTVVIGLLADALAAVLAALFYGLPVAVLLGLTAGVSQALGKIALDSTIQSGVNERHRTSAFARSETLLQLSWVIGGFIGIALPLVPRLGLGVLAGMMIAWTAFVLLHRPQPAQAQPG
ncbi:MAG: MFS transporter [Actinomycetota bacterium]|nr:MFS transporter [Actinomycetota bacterium]